MYWRRLAAVAVISCLAVPIISPGTGAASQVFVDARPALGILSAGARVTNPQALQAELTLQNGLKLWFAVRANPSSRVATSPGSSLAHYLSKFYLLAPQAEVKFLGTFPEPRNRITLVATLNSLDAALLNIEQALVTGALAMVPGSARVAPRSMVAALQAFKDINAIRQAAMAFIPPPKTKTQWAKASLRAIDSLRVLLRDDRQAALLVEAFKKLGLSVSSAQVKGLLVADNLRGLLKIIADEAVYVYVTKGKEPTVIFEREPETVQRQPTLGAEAELTTLLTERSYQLPVAIAPNGHLLFFSQDRYQFDQLDPATRSVSRWQPQVFLPSAVSLITELSWSPNGDRVIFLLANLPSVRTESPLFKEGVAWEKRVAWLLDFRTRKLTYLALPRARGDILVQEITWTPDQQHILFYLPDVYDSPGIYRSTVPQIRPQRVVKMESGRYEAATAIKFSPSRRRFLLTATYGQFVVNLATGRWAQLPPSTQIITANYTVWLSETEILMLDCFDKSLRRIHIGGSTSRIKLATLPFPNCTGVKSMVFSAKTNIVYFVRQHGIYEIRLPK